MMRYISLFIPVIFCFINLQLNGQSFTELNSEIKGTVYKSLDFNSKIVDNKLKYSVYLPPYYHTSNDSFPVLYLLHGYGGNETSWIDRCNIHRIIDSLILIREIPPMIIVMPDGKNSYYINDYQHKFPYENIFIGELIPYIDSTYKSLPFKKFRYIAGLSMGGYGAVVLSIKHHDVFGICIALSAALRTDEMIINEDSSKYSNKFSDLFGGELQGSARVNEYWRSYSPFYLLNDSISGKLKNTYWYINCGMNDFLIQGNESLHAAFLKLEILHEYHVRVGSHNWEYWKTGIIEGIKFAGKKEH
jgi:S-formylglutathione hydrolase FrmB